MKQIKIIMNSGNEYLIIDEHYPKEYEEELRIAKIKEIIFKNCLFDLDEQEQIEYLEKWFHFIPDDAVMKIIENTFYQNCNVYKVDTNEVDIKKYIRDINKGVIEKTSPTSLTLSSFGLQLFVDFTANNSTPGMVTKKNFKNLCDYFHEKYSTGDLSYERHLSDEEINIVNKKQKRSILHLSDFYPSYILDMSIPKDLGIITIKK